MLRSRSTRLRCVAALLLLGCGVLARAQTPPAAAGAAAPNPPPADPAKLSFFVTSAGAGKGADLGGLAGADALCQALAGAVGAGQRTWHAYLSTQAFDGQPAINARDRIGQGPWFNIRGVPVAKNLSQLHGDTLDEARLGSNLSRSTALTEKNELVPGFGDKPNEHDILTGSRPDGTAFGNEADHSCRNYTSSASDGSVQVGHFDRTGGGNTSWNSAHPSRGCSQDNLVATGGAGRFYCFAIN
jgi:hypothetical protein